MATSKSICNTNTNTYTTANTISTSGLYSGNDCSNTYATTAIGIANNNFGYFTVDDSYIGGNFRDIFKYLKEDEITNIMDKVIERCSDDSEIKKILKQTIRSRHFSEEFLLNYISYVEIGDILVQHEPDLKSQAYSQLALIAEGLK